MSLSGVFSPHVGSLATSLICTICDAVRLKIYLSKKFSVSRLCKTFGQATLMLQIARHNPIRSPIERLPINQIVISHHHIHRSRQPIPLILPHRRNIFLALKELLRVFKILHVNLTTSVEIQQFKSLKRRRFLLVFGVEVVLSFIVVNSQLIVADNRESVLVCIAYYMPQKP